MVFSFLDFHKPRIIPANVVEKIAKKHEPSSTYKCFEIHAHWVIGEPG
jgi:hypothetical protein